MKYIDSLDHAISALQVLDAASPAVEVGLRDGKINTKHLCPSASSTPVQWFEMKQGCS